MEDQDLKKFQFAEEGGVQAMQGKFGDSIAKI